MKPRNYDREAAARHLIRKDRRLGRFILRCGQFPPLPKREADLFASLSRAIVYQQLSGKAAATIHGRFLKLFAGSSGQAEECLGFTEKQLRGVGLSRNKALAVLDLAGKIVAGELPGRRKLLTMSDTEVIESLTRVRGIGPWTVQMLLIFNLGRADVMPAGDLAIRKAYQQLMGLDEVPDEAGLLARTRHWSPFRSAAAWYLWRLVDGETDW